MSSRTRIVKYVSTPGLLLECARGVPDEFAIGDALTHILEHVESFGAP